MKKLVILPLLFLLAVVAQAQDKENKLLYFQEAGTFEFGPRIGITTSIVTVGGNENSKVRVSLMGGAFGRYQVSERFGLQVDAVYSSRGGVFPVNDLALGFVDLPLTAVYNVKYKLFGTPMTFDAFAGIQPSFLVSADQGGDVSDQYSSTGVDFVFGTGIPVKRFLFYATTKIGLSKLNDSETADQADFKSISTEWTMAYRIN